MVHLCAFPVKPPRSPSSSDQVLESWMRGCGSSQWPGNESPALAVPAGKLQVCCHSCTPHMAQGAPGVSALPCSGFSSVSHQPQAEQPGRCWSTHPQLHLPEDTVNPLFQGPHPALSSSKSFPATGRWARIKKMGSSRRFPGSNARCDEGKVGSSHLVTLGAACQGGRATTPHPSGHGWENGCG